MAVRIKDWSSWLQHTVVTNAMSMFADVHPKEEATILLKCWSSPKNYMASYHKDQYPHTILINKDHDNDLLCHWAPDDKTAHNLHC